MNRKDYIWEVNRQLSDKQFYTQLDKPIYLETVPMVKNLILRLYDKKFINSKQKLIGQQMPRPRFFYILPKIHKEPKTWPKPHQIPPGRPIVSDYFTAEYLDYFLNPLSVKHHSYIKDTDHFVNLVKNLVIPSNSLLFTADVESLYTNIDIKQGIQAIKNIFHKYPDIRRPDEE